MAQVVSSGRQKMLLSGSISSMQHDICAICQEMTGVNTTRRGPGGMPAGNSHSLGHTLVKREPY